MNEGLMLGILKRLDNVEAKLDACLVLLKMAVTHDDFVYRLDDKSERWIAAIQAARNQASRAAVSLVTGHRESGTDLDACSQRCAGKGPSGTDAAELARPDSSQAN